MERGDWVVAYRLHHGIPVTVPADRVERVWIARMLVGDYGWSVSAAAAALGFNVRAFAELEMAVAS